MKDWKQRHAAAMASPKSGTHEQAVAEMVKAWKLYAAAHERAYGSKVGEDSVLGPAWESIGHALQVLLNGETGRLDCASLDSDILRLMERNGIAEDE